MTQRKRRSSGRITLDDVAARAGVSRITASRALRGERSVAADLSQRVTQAALELGYVPDPAARALASARSNTVAVLVPLTLGSLLPGALLLSWLLVLLVATGVRLGLVFAARRADTAGAPARAWMTTDMVSHGGGRATAVAGAAADSAAGGGAGASVAAAFARRVPAGVRRGQPANRPSADRAHPCRR
jgi:transcriptional regulator with XRE-family HTH domain